MSRAPFTGCPDWDKPPQSGENMVIGPMLRCLMGMLPAIHCPQGEVPKEA